MQAEQLAALIAQAKNGSQDAFIAVVSALMRDVRVFVASYASGQSQVDALVREAFAAGRQQLAQCPASGDVFAWMRQVTHGLLAARLEAADRDAVHSKDALLHVVVQSGREALRQAGDDLAGDGQRLGERYAALSDASQRLLAQRYSDGLTVSGISQEQGRNEGEVAQALFAARAALDWQSTTSAADAGDRLFPAVVEDYLAGSMVPDSRTLLVTSVMQDLVRSAQFERQVRIHLLLSAWFTPADVVSATELVASLPAKNSESSRLRPAAARSSGLHPRPPEAARSRTSVPVASSAQRRGTAGGGARPSSQLRVPVSDDNDPPATSNRLPLIIAGVLVLIGLIGLMVVWSKSSSAQSGPAVMPQVAEGRAPASDGVKFGLVHRAEGQAFLIKQGKRMAAESGNALAVGDGLETAGESGLVATLIADQARLTLKGDGVISALGQKDRVIQAMLASGRLTADAMRGEAVSGILVATPQARVEFAGSLVQIDAQAGMTRVAVTRGGVRITRGDGTSGMDVAAGQVVVVRDGGIPQLEGAGIFVRGINLGGQGVIIAGNRWLGQSEALGSGVILGPGTELSKPGGFAAPGLDFDSKAMLDSGVLAPVGQARVVQELPNGEYDLWLWLASEGALTVDGLTLSLNGQTIPLGQAAAKADNWRKQGPYHVQVKNRKLDLAMGGLRTAHLAGLALHAMSKLEGLFPPQVQIISPVANAKELVRDLTVAVNASSANGAISKVEIYNGETRLGEAGPPIFAFIWVRPPLGRYTFTAKVTDAAGAVALSAPVIGELVGWDQASGILREQWNNIAGGSVSDLIGNPRYAGPPDVQVLEPQFLAGMSGDNTATRWRGWVTPPTDGPYTFWISSDDRGELMLSTDDSPVNKRRIAFTPEYTDFQVWDKFPEQKSATITLVGRRRYYIEAVQKQGGGGSHLSVGWQLPDNAMERPIPGPRLAPWQPGTPEPTGPATPPALAVTPPVAQPTPAPVVPVLVQPTDTTPQLVGVLEKPAEFANLSQEGTEDWIHYGLMDAKSVNRKVSDLPVLGVLKTIDNAEIKRFDNNFVKYSWADGAPNLSANNANVGWFTESSGKGFQFTAPADQTLRKLKIWLGVFECRGQFTATLSDASAPTYRDESVQILKGSTLGLYTLTYRAKSAGQFLTVNFTPAIGTGNINFQAVALSLIGPRVVGFVKGVNLFGDPTTIDGNKWMGMKQAEADGLVLRSARKSGAIVEPKPAVDAGLKAMLTSGAAAKSGEELTIIQRVQNGRYDVTFYVMETVVANARLFDLQVEDQSLLNIGALPINTWSAYGPVAVIVRDGTLDITTKTHKGSPMLMGFSIATSAR